MRVIGVDLSLTCTGISDGTECWTVKSKGSSTASLEAREERLRDIAEHVLWQLRQRTPNLVVVEAPAFASKSGHMHDRSGLWWMVVAPLLFMGTPVAEVAPTALKKYATGKGNAAKGALIDSASRRFPGVDTKGDDNAVDALWLCAMGYDHLGRPLVDLPVVNRDALSKVRWP